MLAARNAFWLLAAAAAVSIATVAAAGAQESKLVAGTLTCKGEGTTGFIVGSTQRLSCLYESATGGHSHAYASKINKIGLDVGTTGPSTLVWTVLGSTTALPRGALAGSYVGVSAEASIAIGGGANALIGGSNKSIVLQPLSVKGQQGFNIAVGVAELSLTPVDY